MYVIYISIRLYLNVFILLWRNVSTMFQGPTGDQHIAEWATLDKYIEINK